MIAATRSVLKGINICFTNKPVRKLCYKPWLISICCYLLLLPGAFFVNQQFYASFALDPSWYASILNWAIWIIGLLISFALATCASLIIVLIISSLYQLNIACLLLDMPIKAEAELSIGGKLANSLTEASASIKRELIKAAITSPLLAMACLLAFFPMGFIVSFLISAWIISFLSLDLPCEAVGYSITTSFRLARRNKGAYISFGTVLLLLFSIPFFAMFAAPFVAASASLYFARMGFAKMGG